MTPPSVLILGGGLAGMGAAYALATAGFRDVTIVERGDELGGLAGTFRQGEHFYPLAYHHILHRDRTLLYFLDRLGALERVRWRRIRMLFRLEHRAFDLARPADFARFPMSAADKLRFVRLMLRCFRKRDWSDWQDRSAAELVDEWAGPGVRHALFEPLTRLKFSLPCSEVSGAWLGARLHFREGSAPLGYIPGTNWTRVLCVGLASALERLGVRVLMRRRVTALVTDGARIAGARLDSGDTLEAERLISTLPTEIYRGFLPEERTPELERIRYTAVMSFVCATRQSLRPDFYWMNLPAPGLRACGLFRLESLNPTIGAPGDACLNFVTHLRHRDEPFFSLPDRDVEAAYLADFARLFGFELQPFWTHLSRLPMYSPVFGRGYRNPPVHSASFSNVYFAGNFRTFPSIASTGTALGSGLEAAEALLADHGLASDLRESVERFRLISMPRA